MPWPNWLSSKRQWLIVFCHVVLLTLTYFLSFQLRFDFAVDRQMRLLLVETLPIVLLIKITTLSFGGLLHGWWRYTGVAELEDIIKTSVVSSVILFVVIQISLPQSGFPRSLVLIDCVLMICGLGGIRLFVRIYQETSGRHVARKNTLIVGAGQAGSRIASQLQNNSQLDLNPIGYVDDDESKQSLKIHGIRVLGKIADAPELIKRHQVECLLIAMPSVSGEKLRKIVEQCGSFRLEMKILPRIEDRITGSVAVNKVRSIRIEDLLGRSAISLDLAAIRQKFVDKVLMVTGAGGSIGSELVRQLAGFQPRKLILYERAENELHKIDIELHAKHPELSYVCAVGDILDIPRLREVITEYHPKSIFHAAAYKHVPMMEKNCFQAIVNNIFGTYNVALLAKQYEVDDFLMISSDKAVNPTNVMGVTKRVAELVILGLQNAHTRFVSVRFGNVLGSNGSVLPLFEQQLAHGGPLTVTHPDARRYFMTIPEAVQLILQASAMGKGGEIFVLDMGEPVLIAELAKNLIRLSGVDLQSAIGIVYTGLRPGEKLFEELKLDGEGIKPTSHAKIRVLDGGQVDFHQISRWLEELSALVESKSVFALVRKLEQIVPEYTPSQELLSLCQFDRHDSSSAYRRAQIDLLHTISLDSSSAPNPLQAA